MPAYQDNRTGTWYCKFYYTDYTGNKKQKCKRGFALKRDAQAWETEYLASISKNPSQPFSDLTAAYLAHKETNEKKVTYNTYKSRISLWITPYFGSKRINEITAADVQQWEDMLCTTTGKKGKPLSADYRQNIVMVLSSLFNYAIKIYGLDKNPVHIAGNTAGKRIRRCNFWTLEQFRRFLDTFQDRDEWYTIFCTMYWTGCRLGELQALTVGDVLTDPARIRINKTLYVINKQPVVTKPKTAKSIRDVYIPDQLAELLADHVRRMYQPGETDRLFPCSRGSIANYFKTHAKAANLPLIRLHDLRHSHASLLINNGASALLVSERLGHENVTTTLDIYSHLFPSKQSEIVEKLAEVWPM